MAKAKTSDSTENTENNKPQIKPVEDAPGNGTPVKGAPIEGTPVESPANGKSLEEQKDYILQALSMIHVPGMKSKFTLQCNTLPPEEKEHYIRSVYDMTLEEINSRNQHKFEKLLRDAKLQMPTATPEGIEYIKERKLDRATLDQILSCQFIRDKTNVMLLGATGCGKTYIANAIGVAACRKGYAVRFARLPDLINDFTFSRSDGTFNKVRTKLLKHDLIIIDEWLLKPIDYDDAYELLEIIDACCRQTSVIFCSQFESKEWYARIDCNREKGSSSTIAEAVLDRIVHNSIKLRIESVVSMRKWIEEHT